MTHSETSTSRSARTSSRLLESPAAYLFSGILFRVVLDVGYLLYVSRLFGYAGYLWMPDPMKYCESWVLYLLLLGLAPKKLNRLSDLFLVMLLSGLLAPLSSLYGLADRNRQHLYIVVLGYILVSVFRKGTPLLLSSTKRPVTARAIALLGAVGVTLWFVMSGAYASFQLDLTAVYEYRREVGEVINVPGLAYANIWAYKVFGPTLLGLALYRKRYGQAAVVFGLHLFWFGVSAHKAVLFYPLLISGLWFLFRKNRSLAVVFLAFAGVVGTATLIYVVSGYGLPASLFVRRVFFVPAQNTFHYYRFFSTRRLVWWSNSLTSAFIEYPYHIGYARLIGEWLGGESHVNNTFLATGFMHAGVLGIVLYGVLAGLLFRLMDSLQQREIPMLLALSVLVIPVRSLLLSADLPTALLSHGVGVGMVMLFLMGGESTSQLEPSPAASRLPQESRIIAGDEGFQARPG